MRPVREEVSGGIDWWPFTRFLITGTVLGLSVHYYLGWRPDLRAMARLPWNVFEILSLAALISFALADLYLLLFLIPLYALAVLNDWFYDLSCWLIRNVLGMQWWLGIQLLGLGGQIILFLAIAFLGLRALARIV